MGSAMGSSKSNVIWMGETRGASPRVVGLTLSLVALGVDTVELERLCGLRTLLNMAAAEAMMVAHGPAELG